MVCPADLPLDEYFLSMRRHYVNGHPQQLKKYGGLRFYESIGTSTLFSHYALPENCMTVFFPGCALAGSRPQRTWELYQHLKTAQPTLGLVLDCCTKPSHDLGDVARFNDKFFALRSFLETHQVKTVITACPNCFQVFKRYAPSMECRSVYQILNEGELPAAPEMHGTITLHDPCVSRHEAAVHDSVRSLVTHVGLECREMKNSRKNRTVLWRGRLCHG